MTGQPVPAGPFAQWVPITAGDYQRGGRHVVYWRAVDADGRPIGSVSRRTTSGDLATNDRTAATWRALLSGPDARSGHVHRGRRELGEFPTRRAAERAVLEAHAQRLEATRRVPATVGR